MSEALDPRQAAAEQVTVEDIRALCGASTPHFALQLRNRILRLIEGLPEDHPARREGEMEIARLEQIGFDGEIRGRQADPGMEPLASVNDPDQR